MNILPVFSGKIKLLAIPNTCIDMFVVIISKESAGFPLLF